MCGKNRANQSGVKPPHSKFVGQREVDDMATSVSDPFGAAADPAMPSLRAALDPHEATWQLRRVLARLPRYHGAIRLHAIRVTRHKPGRRSMIEYDLRLQQGAARPKKLTLIGKLRAGRFGNSDYELQRELWNAGFGKHSADGISVAEPIGVVPRFRMWLQRKVGGQMATALLAGPAGLPLARRVAEAAHKLHRAAVPAARRHTMADELRILRECLQAVAAARPDWASRLEPLFTACQRLAARTPQPVPCGIHRDFYGDQVIVRDQRVYLIDFDLYCHGDPALDIGNFLGHVTEQGLRTAGDADALADVERAIEERFVELSGEAVRESMRAYAMLTLARHVYLSTRLTERRTLTARLLDLCEERLGVATRSRVSLATGPCPDFVAIR
jgi:hypothetical protein